MWGCNLVTVTRVLVAWPAGPRGEDGPDEAGDPP